MFDNSNRWRRRVLQCGALCLILTLAATGTYLGIIQFTGNFAPVVAGEVYRSAQPTGAALEAYVEAHGIRSVINLRGPVAGASWYEEELSASRKLGLTHFDFAMKASEELSQEDAAALISLMDRAPKPLLIHCKAGADRSGLAGALYLAAVAKKGERAAEDQISIYYGHLSLPFASAYAMDRTFEALEPWLGFHGS